MFYFYLWTKIAQSEVVLATGIRNINRALDMATNMETMFPVWTQVHVRVVWTATLPENEWIKPDFRAAATDLP